MTQGNYKGKMISKMEQEWPLIRCKNICIGIEKAFQAQGQKKRLHLSTEFPPTTGGSSGSREGIKCPVCMQN